MISLSIEKKNAPMALLPHQKRMQAIMHELRYPFFLFWGMGSGKSIGGCLFLNTLDLHGRCIVICDKSLVVQWKNEITRFVSRNCEHCETISINIIHYEFLDTEDSESIDFSAYQLVIVDEAHRFRNAWHKKSVRMLSWIERIHACEKIVYLSGTPIVNDPSIEFEAFLKLMKTPNPDKRVFYYDPRTDPKTRKNYATTEHCTENCFMSWAQCFKYMMNRKQNFELLLPGEDTKRVRTTSKQFAYNTQLRSVSNNPFPDCPESSPKLASIRDNIQSYRDQNMKQIVYSSRRDAGVDALDDLLEETTFRIDGTMSMNERAEHIRKFNIKANSILLITDAGGQGVDLKRVDVVHLMEPADSIQEENQIINRAVRYKSHKEQYSRVTIIHYILRFPKGTAVSFPWKHILYESGMFYKDELKGLTRKVQKALWLLIDSEENNETLDQRIFRKRLIKESLVQETLKTIKSWSI